MKVAVIMLVSLTWFTGSAWLGLILGQAMKKHMWRDKHLSR